MQHHAAKSGQTQPRAYKTTPMLQAAQVNSIEQSAEALLGYLLPIAPTAECNRIILERAQSLTRHTHTHNAA
jgi:hypothetical protein